MELLIVLVVIGFIALLSWAVMSGSLQGRNERQEILATSTMDPSNTLSALGRTIAGLGYVKTYEDAVSAVFSREIPPSCAFGILWFLVGIIPGILYLVFGKYTTVLTVSTAREGEATRVTLDARGRVAINDAIALVRESPQLCSIEVPGLEVAIAPPTATRQVAQAVVLTAIAVAFSPLFIPIGITKVFPAQHMVNVLGAVLLGPWYALAVATAAGIIRNALNIGTIFAFPGGMIGAFLAGYLYHWTRNIYLGALGEIVGTGLIGATVSALIVGPVFLGKTMALSTFIIAFSASTVAGSIIGVVALLVLRRAGYPVPT